MLNLARSEVKHLPGRLAVGRQVLALETVGSNPTPAATIDYLQQHKSCQKV